MPRVVGASIDVGSNSVHLLVAAIADHRLEPLVDESAFLGLGAAVHDRHHLGVEARAALAETLAGYATTAREHGATDITIIGTEPIRRAADGPSIVKAVSDRVGSTLYALTHEEEAYLTVVGVTEGQPAAHPTLVIDVGGGSSEFCLVGPDERPHAIGLRLGSDRLTRRFARHDPPTADERAAMLDEARAVVDSLPAASSAEIVAVGGTVSNLLKVVRNGERDGDLSRADTARALEMVVAEPADAIAVRYALKPIRARILPAGAVIVEAILARYGADSLRVSDAGIREGIILAVAHAGRGWRDRLPDLAGGWRA
jgi:exopolyphosphatase / guanosine-5'-triphosphate,3'-diphosphate pyrophosphatase